MCNNEKVKSTYLVDIIRINTVTSLFGSSLDSLLHDLSDVLLALLAVNVDIPFVPLAKLILKSLGTGTHALFVDRNPFSTITIRVESEFVAPGFISYDSTAAKTDQPGRLPGTCRDVTNDLLSLLMVIRTGSLAADEVAMIPSHINFLVVRSASTWYTSSLIFNPVAVVMTGAGGSSSSSKTNVVSRLGFH